MWQCFLIFSWNKQPMIFWGYTKIWIARFLQNQFYVNFKAIAQKLFRNGLQHSHLSYENPGIIWTANFKNKSSCFSFADNFYPGKRRMACHTSFIFSFQPISDASWLQLKRNIFRISIRNSSNKYEVTMGARLHPILDDPFAPYWT